MFKPIYISQKQQEKEQQWKKNTYLILSASDNDSCKEIQKNYFKDNENKSACEHKSKKKK